MKRLLLVAAFAALSACHHAPQPEPAAPVPATVAAPESTASAAPRAEPATSAAPAAPAAPAAAAAPATPAAPAAPAATDVGTPHAARADGRAAYGGDRRPAVFPADWPYPAGEPAVFGKHAMVASDAPLASRAGVEILRRGGNAVDAAVAVGFALAVVYPEAGNLGGGGYMVIHLANGRTAAIDFREEAPGAATHDMYLDASGKPTDRSIIGPLSSGVPGTVAGLVAAQLRYGTMPLARVMAPAIRYATRGFIVDSAFSRSLEANASLIARYAGAAVFLPGGRPLPVGYRLRQPALARTLRRIAAHGARGFYRGETARQIAAEEKQVGGIITAADLAHYAPAWRTPIRSTYHGYTLLTMPPSSSGGVTITESLNILEDLPRAPFGSTRYTDELASAYQRAFVDRNAKIADPAFLHVPIAQLTSKEYAAQLRATIAPDRATPTAQVMQEMHSGSAAGASEGTQTTHFSVADRKGDAVAMTYTLNALYGSGVYIPGAGFFMNDEMDDFATKPGAPNMFGLVQGEANSVAPGKRPLSAMSPTIVLDRAGHFLLAVGSRGGPRIITSTSQVILNVLDHHMILSDAMSAPRIHDQALPDKLLYERGGLAPAVVDSLQRMGWTVSPIPAVGLVNAVMKVRGGYEGMSDPRSSGQPVGY